MKYFDRRENQYKTLPDCAAHRLRWNYQEQRCERIGLLDLLLGNGGKGGKTGNQRGLGQMDFSYDLFGGGGGYLVDGGGGYLDGSYLDYTNYIDTSFLPTDTSQQPIDYADYTQAWPIEEPQYQQMPDPYQTYYDFYVSIGYDPQSAADAAAATRAQEGIITIPTVEHEQLPQTSTYPTDIYTAGYGSWVDILFPPTPTPETPPPPPPLPTSPAYQQPGLPPACPGGTYHPYPIGHPQQDICVPFPPAGPSTAPVGQQPPFPPPPSGARPGVPPQPQQPCPPPLVRDPWTMQCVQKPPATQRCLPGQYPSSQTGQCMAIPPCAQIQPGTVFDPNSQRCVPYAMAQGPHCPMGYWPNLNTMRCELIPQCPGAGMVFDMTRGVCMRTSQIGQQQPQSIFDQIPWWLWLLLAAILLMGNDDHHTTTVRHRRSS